MNIDEIPKHHHQKHTAMVLFRTYHLYHLHTGSAVFLRMCDGNSTWTNCQKCISVTGNHD